jgi:DNA-binding GntR family transcriptional regulator
MHERAIAIVYEEGGGANLDAYVTIRTAIIEGDYEPGQRLTEEFLSAELNVSRTPIREAIRQLEAEGLVTSLKRGVSVRDFSSTEIRQIYDLRALLEGYAASLAALYMSQEEIERLHRLNDGTVAMIADPDRMDGLQNAKDWLHRNNGLHEGILRASRNGYIQLLISKVIALPVVFRSYYWRTKEEILQALHEHTLILRAIEERDPHRAEMAMAEHIHRGKDHVLANLPSMKREALYTTFADPS